MSLTVLLGIYACDKCARKVARFLRVFVVQGFDLRDFGAHFNEFEVLQPCRCERAGWSDEYNVVDHDPMEDQRVRGDRRYVVLPVSLRVSACIEMRTEVKSFLSPISVAPKIRGPRRQIRAVDIRLVPVVYDVE